MVSEEQTIFRKKTIDRISSPEDLTDYLKVTNPGIWIVLIAVIVLLAGIFVWSAVGTLETLSDASIIITDHRATVVTDDAGLIEIGMPVRVSGEEAVIADIQTDEYGRKVGIAEILLPDGTYQGQVVTDQTHPIQFLTEAGGN